MDGVIIDKITRVSSMREKFSATDPTGHSRRLLRWVDEVEEMVMSWSENNIEEDEQTRDRIRLERHKVLWRTLAPEDPKPPYGDGCGAATERGFNAWRRYQLWEAESPIGATTDLFTPDEVKEGKFFKVACTYATTHRRAFLTSKGQVGLGYQGTSVGDEVAILFGGVAPYLIRQVAAESFRYDEDRREYQLVGEAYLHGLEDGEGVDQSGKESLVFL
jgi:hypothetical protein